MGALKAIAVSIVFAAGSLTSGSALAQDLRVKGIPAPPEQKEEAEKAGTGDSSGSSAMKPGSSTQPGLGQAQKDAGVGPAAGKTGVIKPPPPKKHRPNIRFSCDTIMCIDRVRVDPKGSYADFEVITTQPARVFIEVGLMRPKNHKFSRVERAIFTVPYRNSSKTKITGLTPNETYYYVVQAKDEGKLEQWEEGSFSTSGRRVKIQLDKIHVYDDGDDLGAGDFVFEITSMSREYEFRANIATGDNYTLGRSFTVTGAPPRLEIVMNVNEQDQVPVGPGTGPDFKGVFNVETSGPGENETRPFEIRGKANEFDLILYGRLEISYD